MEVGRTMKIWCCTCSADVDARLTNGAEIYPHRSDLYGLPFWKCDTCGCYVGTHHKTENPTKPLGVLPTEPIRKARGHIHKLIDGYWKPFPKGQERREARARIYGKLSKRLGYTYHSGEIRDIEEARRVWKEASVLVHELEWDDARDIVVMMKEQIARFEGQPEIKGNA